MGPASNQLKISQYSALSMKCFINFNNPKDWADAQADLSLRWAHMLFCWFCHALAQIFYFFTK